MRIFLSHTSRHKPLVREVKNHLPQDIRPWIDEKDLFVGENISDGIKNVIEKHTDFVIIFVDSHAVSSEWVKQELQWALEYEQKLGRTFVLPVVLDREAWDRIEPEELRKRKFLECVDFSEEGIKTLANGLIFQLVSWAGRDLAQAQKQPLESSLKLIDEADRYLKRVANDIRVFVHAYNRDNPLPLNDLYEFLKTSEDFGSLTDESFHDLLARLRQQGYLAGLVYDNDVIFVEEEHYGWKTTVFTEAKQKIARKAVSYIRSGQVIALDAGSTTNEIARLICSGLKRRMWTRLTIVTNSIPASNQLVTAGDELGLEDQNDVLRVFVAGGRVRPNTLAIVDDASLSNTAETNLERLLADLGGADLAYVGTNGVYWGIGFTTSDITETTTKAALLKGSQRKFVVTDPSKFDIRQGKVFAKFDENIEVITTRGAGTVLNDYELKFKDTTTSIVYAD